MNINYFPFIFGLLTVLFNQCACNQVENQKEFLNVSNALENYCNGKMAIDFCSKENLQFTKMLLLDRQVELEKKKKKEIARKVLLKKIKEMEQRKIIERMRQDFLDRHI